MELATRKTLPDSLEWVKVSSVGVAGRRLLLQPLSGSRRKARRRPRSTRTIRSTSTRSARRNRQDMLVYEDKANAQRFHILDTTEDERFAILTISERGKGKNGNARLLPRSVEAGEKTFTPIVPEIGDDKFSVLDNVGDKLLIDTNRKAPNQRVFLFDPKKPGGEELEDHPAGDSRSRCRAQARPAGSSSQPI